MGRDHVEEQTLLYLSRAQRLALADRWPLILSNAGEVDLAEEIRRELSTESALDAGEITQAKRLLDEAARFGRLADEIETERRAA